MAIAAFADSAKNEKVTNVSEYIDKKCKVAFSGHLTDKIDLEILSPEYVRFEGEPIRKAYCSVIEIINKYHYLNYAPHKLIKWLERHRKAKVRGMTKKAPT